MGYATIQPRGQGMGSFLSREWFASDDSHGVYAVKAAALAGYVNWNRIAHGNIEKIDALGFTQLTEANLARQALYAWDAKVRSAQALIDAADAKLAQDNAPSAPPPLSAGGFALLDWRRSWYLDTGDVDGMLPALEEANVEFNNAMTAYERAVNTAKNGRVYSDAPPIQTPVDWSRANVPSAAKEALTHLQGRLSLFGDFSLTSIVIGAVVIGGLWLWTWLPKGKGRSS